MMPLDRPETDAPTVVFVNSLATSTDMWDGVVREFDGRVDAIRYDQRDRSRRAGERSFTLDDLVDDLFARADAASRKRVHIVGVSLGGIVALRAAAREPDRVLSVSALCCSARFPRDSWLDRGRQVRAGGYPDMIPLILARWFTEEFRAESPGIVDRYRAMLASTDVAGYAAACDVLAEADVRGDLPRIASPTLVISGEFDPANPIADQQAIAAGIPHARHEIVRGVAHLAPAQDPRAVTALLHDHVVSAQTASAR